MDLRNAYEDEVRAGTLKPDPAQARIVQKLADLEAALEKPAPSLLARLLETPAKPRGLYIQGDVGRGKTMLMDKFFAAVDIPEKRRVHFHAFMQDVHARLHRARRHERDALKPVVQALAAEAPVALPR